MGCLSYPVLSKTTTHASQDEALKASYTVKGRLLEFALQKGFKPFSLAQAERILSDLEEKNPISLLKKHPSFDYISLLDASSVTSLLGEDAKSASGEKMKLKNGQDAFIGVEFATKISRPHLNYINLHAELKQSQLTKHDHLKSLDLEVDKMVTLHQFQWISNQDLVNPIQKRLLSRQELKNILTGAQQYAGEDLVLWHVYSEVHTAQDNILPALKKQSRPQGLID
tara:strand:- start:94 stop:771 length:678 start_codon:yes stop_codon:yes gene_type:complete